MPEARAPAFGGIVPGGRDHGPGLTRLPTDEDFSAKLPSMIKFERQCSSSSTSLESTFRRQATKEDLSTTMRGKLRNRICVDVLCCRRCRQRADGAGSGSGSNGNKTDRI
ncbi:unnamed protein product [Amoebophrya sp. A120]|nr:unnamed protein product [Amoebophrya sp. A120]|eukprot:GSA120T00013146001.1